MLRTALRGLSLLLILVCFSTALAQDRKPNPAFEPVTVEPASVRDVTGKYGGTLTWSSVGEIGSFNPLVDDTVSGANVFSLMFDSLTTYDYTKWETTPSLAHQWEVSGDNLTYTFHLRKGVRFSDGDPLDAADVIFSFDAVFNPKVPNSAVSLFQVGDNPLPTYEKVDQYTVRFQLPAPNVLFLEAASSVQIFPSHLLAKTLEGEQPTFSQTMKTSDDPKTIVASGPYRVLEYTGAERVVLERNPYHWQQDKDGNRLPYTDRVIILIQKDINTQMEQFLAGKFDLLNSVQPRDLRRFRKASKTGGFDVHRLGIALSSNWLVLNLDTGRDKETGEPFVAPHKLALFSQVKFRHALSHAIDRKNLVKLFLDGKGEPIYGPTTRGNKAWYSEHTKFPYDPTAAKRLLSEIGLKDRDGDGILDDASGKRVAIELMTNSENPTRTKVIEQIAEDWRALGIQTTTNPTEFNNLVSQLQDGRKFDSILLGWGTGVPPDPLMGKNIHLSTGRLHAWHPQQESPVNGWEREHDAMLEAMTAEADLAKRKALWAKVLEHQATYQPMIYLYTAIQYAAAKPRVKNLRPSLLRPETYHNAMELWLSE